jgi:hypothetical protein
MRAKNSKPEKRMKQIFAALGQVLSDGLTTLQISARATKNACKSKSEIWVGADISGWAARMVENLSENPFSLSCPLSAHHYYFTYASQILLLFTDTQ